MIEKLGIPLYKGRVTSCVKKLNEGDFFRFHVKCLDQKDESSLNKRFYLKLTRHMVIDEEPWDNNTNFKYFVLKSDTLPLITSSNRLMKSMFMNIGEIFDEKCLKNTPSYTQYLQRPILLKKYTNPTAYLHFYGRMKLLFLYRSSFSRSNVDDEMKVVPYFSEPIWNKLVSMSEEQVENYLKNSMANLVWSLYDIEWWDLVKKRGIKMMKNRIQNVINLRTNLPEIFELKNFPNNRSAYIKWKKKHEKYSISCCFTENQNFMNGLCSIKNVEDMMNTAFNIKYEQGVTGLWSRLSYRKLYFDIVDVIEKIIKISEYNKNDICFWSVEKFNNALYTTRCKPIMHKNSRVENSPGILWKTESSQGRVIHWQRCTPLIMMQSNFKIRKSAHEVDQYIDNKTLTTSRVHVKKQKVAPLTIARDAFFSSQSYFKNSYSHGLSINNLIILKIIHHINIITVDDPEIKFFNKSIEEYGFRDLLIKFYKNEKSFTNAVNAARKLYFKYQNEYNKDPQSLEGIKFTYMEQVIQTNINNIQVQPMNPLSMFQVSKEKHDMIEKLYNDGDTTKIFEMGVNDGDINHRLFELLQKERVIYIQENFKEVTIL